MKFGARNAIVGKVTRIKRDGGVMCQVSLEIPASQVASVMTVDSLEEMGLVEGDEVRVVVKAIHVLLVKE